MSLCAKLKDRFHRIFYPPGTTPMQWKIHIVNFIVLFSAGVMVTMLFPYLPAMVKSWGVSEEDTGYYAGVVASMMFTGRIFGSYLWGWLADKFGRRPVFLSSLLLMFLGTAFFGFTTSFAWAVGARLFVGLVNGAVGTCKTVVSDLCDNTNQALGISLVMTSWNLGLILGPAIGGFLSEPSRKYPDVFPPGSFLDKFAFFLPPLVNCVVFLIAILAVYFSFPETYDPKTGKRILRVDVDRDEIAAELDDKGLSLSSTETQATKLLLSDGKESPTGNTEIEGIELQNNKDRSGKKGCSGEICEAKKDGDAEMEVIQPNGEVIELVLNDDGNSSSESRRRTCCCGCFRTCRCLRKSRLLQICRNRGAIMIISLYCLYSFAVIGSDELFSLWAATTPALGGLGFTTDDIGIALLVVSAPVFFLTFLLFHRLERRFGAIKSFQICMVFCTATCVALPFVNNFYDRSQVLWPLLLLFLLPFKLSIGCGFASIALLINNSVPSKMVASVNGLAMTLTSITRAFAPIAGGSIFAWSISSGVNIGFPFDEHLTFICFGVIFLLSFLLSFALPKRLNQQKNASG